MNPLKIPRSRLPFNGFLNHTDHLVANTLIFNANYTGIPQGKFTWGVVIAVHKGKLRPPLLGPSCFGITADDARQVNPDRALSRTVCHRLNQPGRWISLDCRKLRLTHVRWDTVFFGHLHRNI